MNRLVRYERGKRPIQGVLNLSVHIVILTAMGRPRKFSREGVLEKALPVFWKYGFARTTLPDLEQATGVNKSGLYAEFESKEALFLACLRHYLGTRNGSALLMAEPLGWGNIERFLEEGPSRAIDRRGCFFVNSMRELEGLPAEARKVIADGRARLNQLLRANVAFEKPKMDVTSLCELISAFFSGICIEANVSPDRKQTRRKIGDFMQMLRTA
jgi:TetR/AcrR family transcriptional regulator, copper-responsive repressor